ncbi:MAG: phosphoribosylamine--glycine ligase [Oligoflexia bacterium]|nr:phosphoribosylamine--glycine ligase [Oligoflexia bacterium]
MDKVLVLGSGGREHAICFRLLADDVQVHCFPGNAGMLSDEIIIPSVKLTEESIREYCLQENIDKIIIGPEQYIVNGLSDQLKESFKVIAPSIHAVELEASKSFSKEFMIKYDIPTAKGVDFNDTRSAQDFYHSIASNEKAVIKVDGLASGKGVFLPENLVQADEILKNLFENKDYFIQTNKVVIEELLVGLEFSMFYYIKKGKPCLLGFARDHKRLLDGNKGPNTGGMGCISYPDLLNDKQIKEIETKILYPTLAGMRKEGREYEGFLFLGLMLTKDGFKVIEYNCRLGDPETQTILPLLKGNFYHLLFDEETFNIERKMSNSIHVVCSSENYSNQDGKTMLLDQKLNIPNITDDKLKIFFAGVKSKEGSLVNSGGRVLGVTSIDSDLECARNMALNMCKEIDFNGKHFRRDIGHY